MKRGEGRRRLKKREGERGRPRAWGAPPPKKRLLLSLLSFLSSLALFPRTLRVVAMSAAALGLSAGGSGVGGACGERPMRHTAYRK
jgi:hypothetical protein